MPHTLSGRQWAQTQHRLARQSSYLDHILCKPIVLPSISTKSVANVPYARVTQKIESTSFYCVRLCPNPVTDTWEISVLCILNMTFYPTIWKWQYFWTQMHVCIQSVTELIWRWHLGIVFTVTTATARGYWIRLLHRKEGSLKNNNMAATESKRFVSVNSDGIR